MDDCPTGVDGWGIIGFCFSRGRVVSASGWWLRELIFLQESCCSSREIEIEGDAFGGARGRESERAVRNRLPQLQRDSAATGGAAVAKAIRGPRQWDTNPRCARQRGGRGG